MTNHGDDCYFFYYSTCVKGDSCPFRHCEAAMGSETVCNLWQEGRCFRTICKFRHMEITKNRKEIPCYWENQPAGCQKPHCAFLHEKARCVDGIFVQPERCVSKNEEQPLEDPAPPLAAPLLTVAIPQLRGVIKLEAQDAVPSPTHPPVVINPADDDEDEDEEGEDNKVGPSPRKLPKSDDSLNFGVSTLEEIRLRKALKASMKKVVYPIQSTLANGEKENLQSFFRPDLYETRDGPLVPLEETGRPRASVTTRLGRKMPATNLKMAEGFVLKRSLAERLGKFGEEEASEPPQKSLKSMKERLCLPAVPIVPVQPAETNTESNSALEQFHIKTLEEIRQEKAAKCQPQSQNDSPLLRDPESTKTPTPRASKGVKRAITVDKSLGRVKTFSEILRAKKKRQEEQSSSLKNAGLSRENPESGKTEPVSETTNVGGVKVKTLEEIRREKAAMTHAQHAMETEKKKTSNNEENRIKKSHRLHINQLASLTRNITKEERGDVAGKLLKTQTAASGASFATSNDVKVKTFEEIMREKRLRKQGMEEQDKILVEELHSQKHADGILKRQAPVNSQSSPSTILTPKPTSSSPKLQALTPLKSNVTSPLISTAHHATTVAPAVAVTLVPDKQSSYPGAQESHLKCPQNAGDTPDKNRRNSTALSTAKQSREARQDPTAEPPADKTLSNNQKKSQEHTRDTKVRPKLNVKPSVMKSAVQVKPGQKRGTERSAVAAVKPLNSSCRKNEEQRQETMHRGGQELQSSTAEAQLSSADLHSPSTVLNSDFSSTPLREDLQTVPVFKLSQSQETAATASAATTKDTCAVRESPVQKTPIQSKARRQSSVVSRTPSTSSATPSTSAVDDFEELMNEFTDDHLEEDMDPGIGEDDLLQELSEMIDS